MAFLEGWRWLSSSRFKMIVQTLAGKLDITQPLIFLKRIPMVNAFDDEIVGRWTGRVYAADVIADDQAAAVYQSGQLQLSISTIPNLKIGQKLNQHTLQRLARMQQGALLPSDNDAMDNFFNNLAENLIMGVRQRMNDMLCGMLLDSYAYNRLGVNFTMTFGMPANLKVTPSQAWSTDGTTANTSATPIDDILIVANQTAADNYGQRFNRVTMSSKAFRFMVGTTQFANRASLLTGFATTAAMINVADQPTMQAMMGRLLNMEIELYDGVKREQDESGNEIRTRVLPANKVILSRTEDDNDGNVFDLANAVVTESVVAGMVGNAPEGLGGEQFGPIGYFTPAAVDYNPPGVVAWGVGRAVPRKHVPEASAVLTVGTWS